MALKEAINDMYGNVDNNGQRNGNGRKKKENMAMAVLCNEEKKYVITMW